MPQETQAKHLQLKKLSPDELFQNFFQPQNYPGLMRVFTNVLKDMTPGKERDTSLDGLILDPDES